MPDPHKEQFDAPTPLWYVPGEQPKQLVLFWAGWYFPVLQAWQLDAKAGPNVPGLQMVQVLALEGATEPARHDWQGVVAAPDEEYVPAQARMTNIAGDEATSPDGERLQLRSLRREKIIA